MIVGYRVDIMPWRALSEFPLEDYGDGQPMRTFYVGAASPEEAVAKVAAFSGAYGTYVVTVAVNP